MFQGVKECFRSHWFYNLKMDCSFSMIRHQNKQNIFISMHYGVTPNSKMDKSCTNCKHWETFMSLFSIFFFSKNGVASKHDDDVFLGWKSFWKYWLYMLLKNKRKFNKTLDVFIKRFFYYNMVTLARRLLYASTDDEIPLTFDLNTLYSKNTFMYFFI